MSGNFEEELENIKASLKHLGAIEESLMSDNYLDSRSVSDLESIHDIESISRAPQNKDWAVRTQSDFASERSFVAEKNLLQCNEIIKEKSNLINRLYNCIEELKGEIQEITASLDYHMQVNGELEKELEFYRYSKEPNENYDIHFLQSEFHLLQEKYEDAMNQLRSKDLKNAELTEMITTIKQNESASMFQGTVPGLNIDTTRIYNDNQVYEEVCSDLARELQIDNLKDILPRVIHLKEYYNHSKEFRKLYKKLAQIMIVRVGRSNIGGLPSCMSLWKWTANELEALQIIVNEAKVKNAQELVEKIKYR